MVAACEGELEPLPESSPIGLALANVRAHEDELRRVTDFTAVVGRHRALGPDPYAVALAPGGAHLVALLRGEDAVVLLDQRLREIARAPAPRFASALAVDGDSAWVGGEGSGIVVRLTVGEASLAPAGAVDLGVSGVRAIAAEGGLAFAVDAVGDALVAFDASGEAARTATARGPLRVDATARWVVVSCLIGHRIEVFARDDEGLPMAAPAAVYVRRGPAWAIDAEEDEDGTLWIAAGAVEDEDLDRTIGAFGHIDSVVEVFRLGPGGLGRVASIDVAAHGLVVPKSIALAVDTDTLAVRAVAAGAPRGIDLTWSRDGVALGDPEAAPWSALPGTTSFVGGPGAPIVGASPLFDAFWSHDPTAPDETSPIVLSRARAVASRTPTASQRLGEALLTTELIAPGQGSDGAFSRFTCETCHFELGVDGRTHLTGREDHTAATTKPLYGMLENGPHFTRGLDRDLTAVAHNEVRVANLHVPIDPWFSIDRGKAPWLDALIGEGEPGLLGPLGARRAMVDFLAALAHRPSIHGGERATFSEVERHGATVFRDRCVSCHAARLVTNDVATEVPFEDWERLIFSDADPITWARDGYEKTGVEPYVHADGARTTSLRRVIEKRPYFTNGSADTLAEVLARARFGPAAFFHVVDGPAGRHELDPSQMGSFGDREIEALLAFLELL